MLICLLAAKLLGPKANARRLFWNACLILILLFLFGPPSRAQPHTGVPARTTPARSSKQIQDLLDHAAALPVEYQADLVLELLDNSPDKLSLRVRQGLIKSLIERSAQAIYPVAELNATDDYDGVSNQVGLDLHWLRLDGLDIAVRSIAAGKQSASTSLQWLSTVRPPVERSNCSDSLTPDVRSYYRLLMQLVAANERAAYPNELARADYLVENIHLLKSPAQLWAFMDAFSILRINPDEFALTVQALAAQMDTINASDREMTGAEGDDGEISHALRKMLTGSNTNPAEEISLLNAYRRLLTRALHSHACQDFTLDRKKESERFNSVATMFIGDTSRPVHALGEKDLAPTAFDPGAPQEQIDLQQQVQAQLRRIFQVSKANQQADLEEGGEPDAVQPEPSDVNDVVQEARRFEGKSGESKLAVYENRQAILALLIELLPPGDSLRDAVDAEGALLNLNPIEDSSPTSWLRVMKNLILISRPVTPEVRKELQAKIKEGKRLLMMPSGDGPFIRQTLRRYQSDRIIATYLEFENVFTPAYRAFKFPSIKRTKLAAMDPGAVRLEISLSPDDIQALVETGSVQAGAVRVVFTGRLARLSRSGLSVLANRPAPPPAACQLLKMPSRKVPVPR